MKRQSAHLFVVGVLALLGPLAQNGRGDFILWNDEQLTVNSSHNQGTLYDTSRAFIVPGGSVRYLYAYDSSDANVSGGSVSAEFNAYDSSIANVSGGSVWFLEAYDSSTVNISGGIVFPNLDAYDSSAVNISGGSVSSLSACGSGTVDISGGTVNYLWACGSGTVDISGGTVNSLGAAGSGAIIFYGQNFRVGAGLTFDGERVLGTGILSGEWMDGTRWAVNITTNPPTATILAIPESEHRPFCVKYPRMDFNGDCKVDFADFAIMASSWLECNLVPKSACWE